MDIFPNTVPYNLPMAFVQIVLINISRNMKAEHRKKCNGKRKYWSFPHSPLDIPSDFLSARIGSKNFGELVNPSAEALRKRKCFRHTGRDTTLMASSVESSS
jgi:hypothetical protein